MRHRDWVMVLFSLAGCGQGEFFSLSDAPPEPPARTYVGAVTAFLGGGAIAFDEGQARSLAAVAFPVDLRSALPLTDVSDSSETRVQVGGGESTLGIRVLLARLAPLVAGTPPALEMTLLALPQTLPALGAGGPCRVSVVASELQLTVPLILGRDLVGQILVSPAPTELGLSGPLKADGGTCAGGTLAKALESALITRIRTGLAADTAFLSATAQLARRLLGADLPIGFRTRWNDGASVSGSLVSRVESGSDPLVIASEGAVVLPLTVTLDVVAGGCAALWAPALPAAVFSSPPDAAVLDNGADATLSIRGDVAAAFAAASIAAGAWCATEPLPIGTLGMRASELAAAGVDTSAYGWLLPETPLYGRFLPLNAPAIRFSPGGRLDLDVPNALVEVFARSGDQDLAVFRQTAPLKSTGLVPVTRADLGVALTGGATEFGDAGKSGLADLVLRALLARSPIFVIPDRLAFPIAAATFELTENHWLVRLMLARDTAPTWGETRASIEAAAGARAAGCGVSRASQRGGTSVAVGGFVGLLLIRLSRRRQ